MSSNAARRLSPRQRAALWRWAFIALGLIAFVLGFAGFMAQSNWTWSRHDVHQSLFRTIQLFALAVSVDELRNGATQLASVLAPLATAGTVWLAFLGRIRRRWQFLLLRWRPAQILLLGCGDTAAAVVAARGSDAAAGQGQRVVGLDPQADSALAKMLQGRGQRARLFRGDAQSADYLDALNAGAAANVWVLTGDDLRNIAIARRVIALRTQATVAGEAVVIVGVREPTLARAQADLWKPQPGIARIEYFDLPRIAARRLLQAHPPAWPPLPDNDSMTPRPLHLCIVGGSDLAPSLLVHAAIHCVHDDDPARCIRLTWIVPEAEARLASLYRRYPVLDPARVAMPGAASDPVFGTMLPLARITALDADPAQFTPTRWMAAQAELPFDMVYVMAGDDLLTLAAAQRVQAAQDVCAALARPASPVVACLGERTAGADRKRADWPATLRQFEVLAACFAAGERYPGERGDALARIVHLAYHVGDVEAWTAQAQEAAARWACATDDFRWSSRWAADHIDVKLALLGSSRVTARLHDDDAGGQRLLAEMLAEEAVIQRLMRIEHRRFQVERLLEGWLPLPPQLPGAVPFPSGLPYDGDTALSQKSHLRLNRTLIGFDALSAAHKAFDRRIIEAIPACLREERRQAGRHTP